MQEGIQASAPMNDNMIENTYVTGSPLPNESQYSLTYDIMDGGFLVFEQWFSKIVFSVADSIRVADGRHLNKLSRRVQTHTLQLHTVAISKCLSWQCKHNVNGTLALLYALPFSVLQYFLFMLLDFCCFESVNLLGYSNSLKRILFNKKTGCVLDVNSDTK